MSDLKFSAAERDILEWRSLLRKSLLAILAIFCIYVVAALLFRRELQSAGIWLGEHFGYLGAAVFTFLVDAVIVPTTADIIFPFALAWDPLPLLTAMSLASMLGGFTGYWLARSFNHFSYVQRVTGSYRKRGVHMINRYGAWAIVIAGLTPVPFSTICWIAGLLKVPAGRVFLATASRIPRMVLYYLIVKGGVNLLDLF